MKKITKIITFLSITLLPVCPSLLSMDKVFKAVGVLQNPYVMSYIAGGLTTGQGFRLLHNRITSKQEEKLATLNTALSSLNTESETIKGKLETLITTLAANSETIGSDGETKTGLHAQSAEIATQIEEAQLQLQGIEEQQKQLTAKLKTLEESSMQNGSLARALDTEAAIQNNTLTALESQIEQTLKNTRQTHIELNEKITSLQSTLETNNTLSAKISTLSDDVKQAPLTLKETAERETKVLKNLLETQLNNLLTKNITDDLQKKLIEKLGALTQQEQREAALLEQINRGREMVDKAERSLSRIEHRLGRSQRPAAIEYQQEEVD